MKESNNDGWLYQASKKLFLVENYYEETKLQKLYKLMSKEKVDMSEYYKRKIKNNQESEIVDDEEEYKMFTDLVTTVKKHNPNFNLESNKLLEIYDYIQNNWEHLRKEYLLGIEQKDLVKNKQNKFIEILPIHMNDLTDGLFYDENKLPITTGLLKILGANINNIAENNNNTCILKTEDEIKIVNRLLSPYCNALPYITPEIDKIDNYMKNNEKNIRDLIIVDGEFRYLIDSDLDDLKSYKEKLQIINNYVNSDDQNRLEVENNNNQNNQEDTDSLNEWINNMFDFLENKYKTVIPHKQKDNKTSKDKKEMLEKIEELLCRDHINSVKLLLEIEKKTGVVVNNTLQLELINIFLPEKETVPLPTEEELTKLKKLVEEIVKQPNENRDPRLNITIKNIKKMKLFDYQMLFRFLSRTQILVTTDKSNSAALNVTYMLENYARNSNINLKARKYIENVLNNQEVYMFLLEEKIDYLQEKLRKLRKTFLSSNKYLIPKLRKHYHNLSELKNYYNEIKRTMAFYSLESEERKQIKKAGRKLNLMLECISHPSFNNKHLIDINEVSEKNYPLKSGQDILLKSYKYDNYITETEISHSLTRTLDDLNNSINEKQSKIEKKILNLIQIQKNNYLKKGILEEEIEDLNKAAKNDKKTLQMAKNNIEIIKKRIENINEIKNKKKEQLNHINNDIKDNKKKLLKNLESKEQKSMENNYYKRFKNWIVNVFESIPWVEKMRYKKRVSLNRSLSNSPRMMHKQIDLLIEKITYMEKLLSTDKKEKKELYESMEDALKLFNKLPETITERNERYYKNSSITVLNNMIYVIGILFMLIGTSAISDTILEQLPTFKENTVFYKFFFEGFGYRSFLLGLICFIIYSVINTMRVYTVLSFIRGLPNIMKKKDNWISLAKYSLTIFTIIVALTSICLSLNYFVSYSLSVAMLGTIGSFFIILRYIIEQITIKDLDKSKNNKEPNESNKTRILILASFLIILTIFLIFMYKYYNLKIELEQLKVQEKQKT